MATREIDAKGGIDKIEIVEEKIIGEVADVTVELHHGNDTTKREKVSLIKQDGHWKLQSGGK